MTDSAEAEDEDPLAFTPIATSGRHDGWTADRQRQFIAALAAMGAVAPAARAVGMTKASAYRLRGRPDAASFARAWDNALFQGRSEAYDIAIDRAINGITTPVYYRGKVIGTRHRYDHRLLMAALCERDRPPPRGKSE